MSAYKRSAQLLPEFQQRLLQGAEEPPCPPLSPTTAALWSVAAPLWRAAPSLPPWLALCQDGRWLEAAGKTLPQSLPARAVLGKQRVPLAATLAGQHCPYAEGYHPCPEGYHPRPTEPGSAVEAVSRDIFPFVMVLAFSRGEGELPDSFSQPGHLVWKRVLPTATYSTVPHPPTTQLPGASLQQSKSWGQAWDTNGRARRGAAPQGSSVFARPVKDHEPSQIRKWEQKNRREEPREEGMPGGKLPDPAPCSSPKGLFKGDL